MSACEPGVSPFVVVNLLRRVVGCAIDFDGEPDGWAIKVENVRTDGMLSAKAEFGQTSAAENLPEENFGQGHFPAQGSRSFKC